MAQKRINDLQLRTDFDATCNMPSDDLVQTWRITGAQILAYIQSAISIATGNIANLAVDGTKIAADAVSFSKLATGFLAVATIKDQKTAGTAGGTFTSGAFRTRDLNTLVDPFSIVTSLTANQFVLPAGTYLIEGRAPALRTNSHQAKLQNITDATVAIIGTTGYSDASGSAGNGDMTHSVIEGVLTIAAPKTFEVQHHASVTLAGAGFGDTSGSGLANVFTSLKITRLK